MFDLKFAGVSKKYRIREEADGNTSSNKMLRKLQQWRNRSKEFWAIRDVDFEVERGESLGIIGHNGAGKSTILKLLSNITTPTKGEIQINGSLSALIEVGSGFHPELTGRENVYLNGSILGMRRREISKKLDNIVDFAGIRPFLDLPVKRYSSGMYVRLGFSIAAHLEPDILLLDEVLAVGDLAFQSKCLQRIEDLKEAGTTIVFISHDLGAVQRLCKQALLMEQGEIIASGSTFDVVSEYQRTASDFSPPELHGQLVTKAAEVTSLRFFDIHGKETDCYETGAPLQARLEYFAHEAFDDCAFEILFYSGDRQLHCQFTTEVSGNQIDIAQGSGVVEFSCDEIGLLPGIVYVDAIIRQRAAPEGSNIDWHYQRAMLRIDPGKMVCGNFYMPHQWRHEQTDIGHCLAAEQTVSRAVSKL
jgi:ABC-type polysaccharide/polyol phosphate transport system ATPase subunit